MKSWVIFKVAKTEISVEFQLKKRGNNSQAEPHRRGWGANGATSKLTTREISKFCRGLKLACFCSEIQIMWLFYDLSFQNQRRKSNQRFTATYKSGSYMV